MAELPKQDGLDDETRRRFSSKELSNQQARRMKIMQQSFAKGSPLSTSDLAQIFGITGKAALRQLQRDMESVADTYDLVCTSHGRSKLWSVKPGSSPRYVLPVLDQNAALAFHLAESLLKEILPANVLGSLKPWFSESGKLLSQKNRENPWYERLTSKREGMQLYSPEIDPKVTLVVYEALQKKLDLKITHNKATGEKKVHTVSPAGIVASNQTLYLLTYSKKYGDYTSYAMHRIAEAELGYTTVAVPAIDEFLEYVDWGFNEFYEQDDEISLVVDFDEIVQRKMLEYALSDDQQTELLSDKWLRVTATVYETGSLHAWLLSYGNRVRVIEPEPLATKINALRKPAPPPPRTADGSDMPGDKSPIQE